MTEKKKINTLSVKDIPVSILQQLNSGTRQTSNLTEWLGVDQLLLLRNVLVQAKKEKYVAPVVKEINELKKKTVNTVNAVIGKQLFIQITVNKDHTLLPYLAAHTSDMVRCWAAYIVSADNNTSLPDLFKKIQAFAADQHFGVREIAWLAIRPILSQHLSESIIILSKWALHKDENIRRFASEATRPRGVWCEHIAVLKNDPAQGLNILEPLRSDPSKYVRDSVGNWLNDASKTQPGFVTTLCRRWQKESNTKETAYIIQKAMRTIKKA